MESMTRVYIILIVVLCGVSAYFFMKNRALSKQIGVFGSILGSLKQQSENGSPKQPSPVPKAMPQKESLHEVTEEVEYEEVEVEEDEEEEA